MENLRARFDAACSEAGLAAGEGGSDREAAFGALEAAAAKGVALGPFEILTLIQTLIKVIPNIQTVLTMLLEIFKPATV